MPEERLWGSEEFIDTLIRGDRTSDVIGLKNLFDAEFPEKSDRLVVEAWWPYQQQTEWPDTFPRINIFWVQPVREEAFYNKHVHPTLSNTLAWAEARTVQVNIFSTTRPEMSELKDAAKRYVKRVGFDMHEKYRTWFSAVQDDGSAEKNIQVKAFFTYFRFSVMIAMQVSTT